MSIKPTYDSASRISPALEEIREVSKYRYLIGQLVRRDILSRYKRSILGVAWTMLNPLGVMIILSIVFSQLFKSVESYPAYILSGIIAWTFFAQTTNAAMSGIIWGGNLLQRIYFPPTIFGISAIGTGIVNLALSIFPLLLVMIFTGLPIRLSIFFLPFSMLVLAAFALGFGLILSTLAIYFPDVTEMYQIILTAWMYLTPIIYPETIYPETLLPLIQKFNPMYSIIKLFRIPIYDGRIPQVEELLPGFLWAVGVLLIGWLFFTSKSNEFAYRV